MGSKKCSICGDLFKTKDRRRKYCLECSDKGGRSSNMRVRKIHIRRCLICDKEFKSPYPRAKYCSDNCQSRVNIAIYEDFKKIYSRKCKNCGKQYRTVSKNQKKFCSLRCGREFHFGKPKWTTQHRHRCSYCNKIFYTRNPKQRYCGVTCRLKMPIKASDNTLRWKVLNRDNFRCQYCGKTPQDGIKLIVDHITPRVKGGMTTLDNLATACADCNSHKTGNSLEHEVEFKERIQKRVDLAIPQVHFDFFTRAELN